MTIVTFRLSSLDMLCDRLRNISITLETGLFDDSLICRTRLLSAGLYPAAVGMSYGSDEGPGLPGDPTRVPIIGDPMNEF